MTTQPTSFDTKPPVTSPDSALSKLKRIGKQLVDNAPIVMGLAAGSVYGDGVYIVAGVYIGVCTVALIVDFFHCRHRWQAGLEAVFPKVIPVTFLVANVIILALLLAGVLTTEEVVVWNGTILTGGLFLASLTSQLIGKPWIRAMAVESMTPEQIQKTTETEIGKAIFGRIMFGITTTWTCALGLMTLINLGVGIWWCPIARLIGAVVLVVVPVITATVIQPRVIKRSRKVPGYDPSSEQLREPTPADSGDAV